MKNRIIKTMAVLIAITIIFAVVPTSTFTASAYSLLNENEFISKINSLKSKYPEKSSPDYTYYEGGAAKAWTCHGFANILAYYCFGSSIYTSGGGWSKGYDSSSFNAGDIVRVDGDGHTIFITYVSGSTIKYAEGNYTYANKGYYSAVRWDVTTTLSALQGRFTYKYHLSGNSLSGTGTHTHSYNTYVWNWDAHPHYKCYKCSCGDVKENKNEPTFVSTCEQCLETVRPSKTVFTGINEIYYEDESITFNWNDCENTTHYNFWLYQKNDDGTWKTYEHTYYVEKGFSRQLPIGQYRILMQSYNKNYYEADHSDWLHSLSDYVYFDVVESGITGTCGDNLRWKLKDDTLTISGTGDMRGYNFNNCPWFSYKEEIKTVIIENGATSIGDSVFENCAGLTSITIPDSVTSIGSFAFDGCAGLMSITIPNSVTSIDVCAFRGCTGLTGITIPNRVTYIDHFTFYGCSGLTSITIPNSVTSIGSSAFSGCAGLTSITIPNSVTSIGTDAFSGCTELESIAVDINNATYHSAGNCIIETESKTLICGCKNSVIPSDGSVTRIGNDAFHDCTGLTNVTIPSSVISIPYGAFFICSGLEKITVDPNNTTYHSAGNCLIETATKELILGCKNSIIPSDGTVTSIGEFAFYYCTGLQSIIIPEGVTKIGTCAFSHSGLTSITIPKSVTELYNPSLTGNIKIYCYEGTRAEDFAKAMGLEYELLDEEQTVINENDPQAIVDSKTVKPGDTLTLHVTLKNTEPIRSIAASDISYDTSALTLTGVNWAVEDAVLKQWDSSKNKGALSMGSVTDMNGAILTLTFEVKDNTAEGDYTISLNVLANSGDGNENVSVIPGVVTVRNYVIGDIDGDENVTDADAIYLLMYTFFPEDYLISQPCDFDGDGAVTDADAIYLLMYTFFPEDYPIA